jgi:hypothetical protein
MAASRESRSGHPSALRPGLRLQAPYRNELIGAHLGGHVPSTGGGLACEVVDVPGARRCAIAWQRQPALGEYGHGTTAHSAGRG